MINNCHFSVISLLNIIHSPAIARLPPSKYKYESEVTKTRDAKLTQRPNTTPATKTTNPPEAEEEKAMTYCFCLPATD